MYETECRGCINAVQHGYFLYCQIHKDYETGGLLPAKKKCDQFSVAPIKVEEEWF